MSTLTATIKLPKSSLEFMINMMQARVGESCKCAVTTVEAGLSRVTGPAQQVMFVIGEVAAHGEDGLIAVSRN
jgi:hypothetical protein